MEQQTNRVAADGEIDDARTTILLLDCAGRPIQGRIGLEWYSLGGLGTVSLYGRSRGAVTNSKAQFRDA